MVQVLNKFQVKENSRNAHSSQPQPEVSMQISYAIKVRSSSMIMSNINYRLHFKMHA